MIAGTLEIKLMADMARLQKDMDQAKGLLRGLTGNADLAADGFKKALESIGKSFEASGIRIGAMGAVANSTLGKMGLDLGTVAKASIVAEKALFGIASTAGINGAAAEQVVVKWNAALTQISKDSNQTTAEIITAFSDLVAKGIDSDSALKMLEPIGKAATATGANIRDIAVAAGAGFSKLGIDADRLTKSLDMMAKAGDLGAFELKDMAGYFDMLTAKSASLGAVGEGALAQLAAAAQIARRGTGEASTAANNLANFLDKLNARGTDENFMKRFGVDLQVVKKEAQASGDYIGYMVAKVREITGGDSAKIASLFPDIQAGAFIKQAVTDFDLYKKMVDEATQATGVVGEKLDTQMRTSAEKLKSVQINLSGAIGNSQAINTLLEKLEQLADWAARHPEIAAALGIGLATAATVGLVGGAVVAGIGATITAITSLSTAIGGISAIVLANPIIAILFGVAVAGAVVYSYWDEITAAINSFWASTKKAFLNGVETIKKYMSFSFLKDEAAKWVEIGRDLMQGLIDGIMAKYQEIINKIKNLGNDMLKTMKNVLGIRSPSREFFEIGEFAGQGFELGLLSKQEEIEEASKKLAKMAMLNTREITETATAAISVRDSKGRFLPAEEAARAVAEYQRASADIAHSLSDALLRGFERGKGFAKNFVLTLKNLFSTLVLRPIIQPIAQGASGVILSMLGMDANASEGGSGGVSVALNWLTVGKSIWSGLSGGFTAFGNSVAGYVSQFGMYLAKGQGMLSGFGTTLVNSAGTISLAASYIGAAATGISIGTLLAGDKSVLGMDGLTTSSIGAVIGAIFGGPIGGFIGGALGGVVNALFGMGEKRYGPTNVVGDFTGKGFTGNLQSEWTQKGGLFRSNKSGVDSQDLTQKAQDTLNGITLGVATAFGKLLSVTGESARSIDGWTFAIKRQLTTEEEMKTLIHDLGNSMGEYLIPEIKDFKKEGESLADTAIRLTDTFIVTQAIYDMLGHSAYATGLASLKMRDDLVQLFGGLQQTSSAMSGFYSNFFTADEQRANSWRQLDNTFKALNLTTPQTREEFRRLAEAQDLTTEEGRLMFVALMQLAPAFAAVTDPIEDVTKALEDLAAAAAQAMNSIASSLDQMRGTKFASQFQAQIALSAAMAKVTAAMPWITSWDQLATIQIDDASNYSDANKILISEALAAGAALGQLVKTAEDAAKALKDKVIADAFDALRRAVDAEKDRLTKIYNDQAKVLNDNISKLRGLSDALGNALDSINPMSRRAAQAQLTSALLLAKTGGIFPTADELSGALRAVSEPSEKLFSNFVDYKRDQAYTTITIESLKKLTDNQLSTEELTLKQLEETHNAEMERLDNIISHAQAQIDALNSINNSVLTVAQALQNFAAAMGIKVSDITGGTGAGSGGTGGSSGTPGRSGILPNGQFDTSLNGPITRSKYQGLPIGYTEADVGGINWVDGYGDAVDPYAEVQRRIALRQALGIPGFASGGYHEGGWRMVGENGPELEYTPPSRIYNNGDSKRMLDTGRVEAAVHRLEETVKAGDIAIAAATTKMAKIMSRWEGNGAPVRLADSADPLQVNVVESVPVPVS